MPFHEGLEWGGEPMADRDIALMAHLMRRAGFGATREELERYAAKGYEATVVELLHPEDAPTALEDEDLIRRYHVDENNLMVTDSAQAYWLYRMINTKRPLEEKLAPLLARSVRHCLYQGQSPEGYTQADRYVPPLRDGQFPYPSDRAVQGPGDDNLPGQQGQPRRRSERKLRAGVAGAILPGSRQL